MQQILFILPPCMHRITLLYSELVHVHLALNVAVLYKVEGYLHGYWLYNQKGSITCLHVFEEGTVQV